MQRLAREREREREQSHGEFVIERESAVRKWREDEIGGMSIPFYKMQHNINN